MILTLKVFIVPTLISEINGFYHFPRKILSKIKHKTTTEYAHREQLYECDACKGILDGVDDCL